MSALDSTYSELGDTDGGFSTKVDTRTLHVKGWGFWPTDVAERFGPLVCHTLLKAPGVRKLEFDMTQLKPMRDEGQESFAGILSRLSDFSVTEVVITTSSHLTKLQLMRIARENAPKQVVRFEQG